ncbi:hypothetical protein Agabi119p4_10727 [Agaricus bisporus var. burnettii]|uniref:Uncharacterized protein n=1 Tax=Agaricus bisporus var. burnettii TaxID=192524 RepID=A0A8H7EWJ3_AGABI|nr:hypothetical protein Agabi119p4_10727 [Agaricus bisporus var. burnettii]
MTPRLNHVFKQKFEKRLVLVCGEDPLGYEAQENATGFAVGREVSENLSNASSPPISPSPPLKHHSPGLNKPHSTHHAIPQTFGGQTERRSSPLLYFRKHLDTRGLFQAALYQK